MPKSPQKPPLANRLAEIKPFYVMAMLDRAKQLEAQGNHIVHMEVGEPDFVTAAPIIQAAKEALDQGLVHYTPASGLPALRDSIANYYHKQHNIAVSPNEVIVTTGASSALSLVLTALLNPGDEVLMADPGYPCNKNFVRLLGATPINIAVSSAENFQLTADLVVSNWSERTKLVMLASPANPSGTIISEIELDKIAKWVSSKNAWLLVDEIYHGLVYGNKPKSAALLNQNTVVINSFSKYFGMTGWRLGWTVACEELLRELDVLSQNMFLAAPTVAQYAALKAFSPATTDILESRRKIFKERRDFLYAELQSLGFTMHNIPQGAFYLYVGCENFSQDSMAFCNSLLTEANVATAPGADFAIQAANTHLRFAYTTSITEMQLGIEQIRRFIR